VSSFCQKFHASCDIHSQNEPLSYPLLNFWSESDGWRTSIWYERNKWVQKSFVTSQDDLLSRFKFNIRLVFEWRKLLREGKISTNNYSTWFDEWANFFPRELYSCHCESMEVLCHRVVDIKFKEIRFSRCERSEESSLYLHTTSKKDVWPVLSREQTCSSVAHFHESAKW